MLQGCLVAPRKLKCLTLTVLSDGRTAYYDKASGTEVIVNPNAGDFATTFVPRDPLQYFENLE